MRYMCYEHMVMETRLIQISSYDSKKRSLVACEKI